MIAHYLKSITLTWLMLTLLTQTYATVWFMQDYQEFIDQLAINLPQSSTSYNGVSGIMFAHYHNPQMPLSLNVTVWIEWHSDTAQHTQWAIWISWSYMINDMSGTIDTNVRFIMQQSSWNSLSYITLDKFVATPNLPIELQHITDRLIDQRYYISGDTIDLSPIPQQAPSTNSIKTYQQLRSQPIITPTATLPNNTYRVTMNKKNMIQMLTSMATSYDDSMTVRDRNQMRKDLFQIMKPLKTSWTFDPQSQQLQLFVHNEWLTWTISLTPKTAHIHMWSHDWVLQHNSTWNKNQLQWSGNITEHNDTISWSLSSTDQYSTISVTYSWSQGDIWWFSWILSHFTEDKPIVAPTGALNIQALLE